MGFFKYPYTDLNELNLDWVIAKIKYIEQASHILYDNSGTGLVATNVQDAINEILDLISSQGVASWNGRSGIVVPVAGDYSGAMVTYDNSGSGLTATNVQSAIDEVQTEIGALPGTFVESFNTRTGAVTPQASDYDADQIDYDNTVSGLTATDVQAAIDELASVPGGVTSWNTRTGAVTPQASDYDADQVDYDNTTSGMLATDVQDAIDELDDRLDNFSVTASQVSYDNTVSGLTATDAQAALDEIANDVLSSGVASFNGRTGAVNPATNDYAISMMSDYSGTPSDGDVMTYDSNTLKWVPGTGGGGGTAATTSFDNTTLGISATNVQDAIEETATKAKLVLTVVHDGVKTWNNMMYEVYQYYSALSAEEQAKLYIVYNNTIYQNAKLGTCQFTMQNVASTSMTVTTLLATSGGGNRYSAQITTGTTTFTDQTTNIPSQDIYVYRR